MTTRTLRPAGLAAGAALAAGFALLATPALAQIAAPAGDAGLWGALNGPLADGLATAATAFVGWGAARFHAATGVAIQATQEERVRQTLLTGLYAAAHAAEIRLEGALTPAEREKLVGGAVDWAVKRMPGPGGAIARLALGQPVLRGMAAKMLGQAAGGGGAAALDLDALGLDPVKLAQGLVGRLGGGRG